SSLGNWYADTGALDRAHDAYHQALPIWKELAAKHPDVRRFRDHLVVVYGNLGRLAARYTNLGASRGEREDWETAEGAFQQAREIADLLLREQPGVVRFTVTAGLTYSNLGKVCAKTDRLEEALAWQTRSVATLEPALGHKDRPAKAREALRNAYWGRAEVLD